MVTQHTTSCVAVVVIQINDSLIVSFKKPKFNSRRIFHTSSAISLLTIFMNSWSPSFLHNTWPCKKYTGNICHYLVLQLSTSTTSQLENLRKNQLSKTEVAVVLLFVRFVGV